MTSPQAIAKLGMAASALCAPATSPLVDGMQIQLSARLNPHRPLKQAG